MQNDIYLLATVAVAVAQNDTATNWEGVSVKHTMWKKHDFRIHIVCLDCVLISYKLHAFPSKNIHTHKCTPMPTITQPFCSGCYCVYLFCIYLWRKTSSSSTTTKNQNEKASHLREQCCTTHTHTREKNNNHGDCIVRASACYRINERANKRTSVCVCVSDENEKPKCTHTCAQELESI